MSVKNRIIQFVENINDDRQQFFSNIFYDADFLKSFHKIEMEHLVNLAVRYPFLNLHWLLTGKGKMVQNEEQEELQLVADRVR